MDLIKKGEKKVKLQFAVNLPDSVVQASQDVSPMKEAVALK